MTPFPSNYLSGVWQPETQRADISGDPARGLAATGGRADGLNGRPQFSRAQDAATLQSMTYGQLAAMLGEVQKVLQANREANDEISLANSGTTQNDSAADIEGASLTLNYCAKAGAAFGDAGAAGQQLAGSAATLNY